MINASIRFGAPILGVMLAVTAAACGAASSTARGGAVAARDSITYQCAGGSATAVFVGDSVRLSLPGGRTATLPRAVSGSGIRYESPSGGLRLIGKGDYATIEENGRTLLDRCVAGAVTHDSAAATNTFVDQSRTFRFTFPDAFDVTGGELGYTQAWRANSTAPGLQLAVVDVPRSLQPGTNFQGARFTIGVSTDSTAVAQCTRATNGEEAAGQVTIGGASYAMFTLADAAAGNLYRTTSARRLAGDRCVAVEYTIHSTNIGNYDPSQHVRAFDIAAVRRVLDGMLRSFTLF
ncbi:MAG TPA: MliC family protein [Gemmatimonadaceae bacterium]|nr:MliC family protein [Gemmatimonadaceae bacterium]